MILEQRQQLIGNGCNQNLIRDAETALATEDADVVVLPRQIDFQLAGMVSSAPITDHRVMVPVSRSVAMIRDSLLRMQMNYEPLIADVDSLVQLFASLFNLSRVELRVEVTDRQSCPKFHCDNVYVRLLTTYYGPTTEYIDVRSPELIQQAPLNAFVFLKGHKHPTYRDRMLHRSPQVQSGTKRFCVILNFDDWNKHR